MHSHELLYLSLWPHLQKIKLYQHIGMWMNAGTILTPSQVLQQNQVFCICAFSPCANHKSWFLWDKLTPVFACCADLAIDVPDFLDLNRLRATGLQAGEEELPDLMPPIVLPEDTRGMLWTVCGLPLWTAEDRINGCMRMHVKEDFSTFS